MEQTIQQDNSVAIVGMGCIFPKANGLEEYWQLLFNGTDAITDIPDKTHFAIKDYYNEDPKYPDHIYCKRGGFIPAVAFDPSKYGIPPNNINATDTSQLLGLIVAEMALKDAGYNIKNNFPNKKRTSIILGVTGTQELVIPLGARLGHPFWKSALKDSGIGEEKSNEVIKRIQSYYPEWQENSFPGLLGNVVAGRIANKLDLGGTNSVIDAACASSLSAIHSAIMELVQGKCDMSVTGGVDALNDIFMHMCFSQTGVLSHTSDAKPFSKDSDGTVLGEGVGMIVLKRLKDAEKNNDRIYAVIKGIGTSSDGNSGGIYAPDAAGQQRALEAAYKNSSIDPCTVESIEAHGTGTRVGDKVEFQALKNFLSAAKKSRSDKNNASSPSYTKRCSVGSVKSMIGHAKAAAGIAGLIKTALSLYHKTHFPTLKADIPDPELGINDSSFYLNSVSKPWISKIEQTEQTDNTSYAHPRRAGVSAFGFGGSNFHAVLEEYSQSKKHVSWNKSVQIIAFSSNSRKELKKSLSDFLAEVGNDQNLDSRGKSEVLAWIAAQSRKDFSSQHDFRLLIVIDKDDNPCELAEKAIQLISNDTKENKAIVNDSNIYFESTTSKTNEQNQKIGFLFPGQGSQYPMMGRDIVSIFPEAVDAVTLADKYFLSDQSQLNLKPLHEYIYPLPEHIQTTKISEEKLRSTDIAQPALGAINLAMTKVLKRFGIIPTSVCGHSFGELCALNASNRINDNDFLKLAVARGKHMAQASKQSDDSGSMFAVKASITKIEQIIFENNLDLVLANRNSYNQGVISGSSDEIDKAIKIFKSNKIRGIKLPVAAAFHSHFIKNAAKPFEKDIEKIDFTNSKIPVMSNTNGTAYPANNKKAKDILGKQLINPVNFIKNIESMHKSGISTFIEIGPKTILTGLVKSILKDHVITAIPMDASTGKKPGSGLKDLAHVLANLASQGHNVDLSKWENPCSKIKKKKMNIFLSGANPKPDSTCDIPPSKITDKPKEKTMDPSQGNDMNKKPIMQKEDITHVSAPEPQQTNEAMVLIQKGLEAMQELQSQTAKTHEKFLETQAEASRTLQSMMTQTQLFATDISMPRAPKNPEIQIPIEQTHVPAPTDETSFHQEYGADIPEQPAEQQIAEQQTAEQQDTRPEDTDIEKTATLIFKVVSRLTGFPEEMLELDMDIESDLGIDSIKRVEIISELEKSLPSVSTLTPESMGSLRTLQEICNVIDNGSDIVDAGNNSNIDISEQGSEYSENTGSVNQCLEILINTISDLTGFPKEMLEGDMDLESDLGVDSIKRVEILSTLEKALPQIGSISSDEIAGFKTIHEISDYLDKSLGQTNTPEQPNAVIADPVIADSAMEKKTPETTRKTIQRLPAQKLSRQIPFLEQHPVDKIKFYNGSRLSISKQKKVYLTNDSPKIALSFLDEFKKLGINAELIELSDTKIPELHDAAGIVLIPNLSKTNNSEESSIFLKNAFQLIKKNAPYLTEAASQKSAFFATVSFLGGGFGFDKKKIIDPVQGGLAGLSKTASLELKQILCKAIDMPSLEKEVIENAENAVTLMMTHGSVEIGISKGICNVPKLKPANISHASDLDPEKNDTLTNNLTQDDLFIITGGAKGVTAECAIELANSFSPKIMLIGRSENPSTEPDWIKNTLSEVEIKKAILANQFAKKTPRPVELEKAYKKIISNREIKENIKTIQATGSIVEYFSCDIQEKDQISEIFKNVREKYGKITGIIHGAGILEDKLIIEKNYEKFCSVFDTKVSGLNSLIYASKKDKLKYFIGFSSIAARTGNIGQSDYSMANEVLNKTLQKLSFENPECKYLSMNWGPWDGGMVNKSLKKEFQKRSIDLIDKKAGARQLLAEMAEKNQGNVEIVIGGSLFGKTEKSKSSLTTAFSYDLNNASAPVLESHKIDNNKVLPFAIHLEWLAHAAEKNNPGLCFTGIDQLRLLKGINFSEESVKINVKTGKCKKADQGFETETSIFSKKQLQNNEENTFLNSAGIALLNDTLPSPPVLSASSSLSLTPYSLSVDKIYESVLFHGKDLHAIKSITGCSKKGIEVTASTAPAPEKWFENHPSRNWIFDPMLLDAAFQAAILWTYENKKQVCLPSYITNFRLYHSFKDSKGDIRIRFTVNETTNHKVKGYFVFLDDNDKILASITGFEAINDPSLFKKFKKTKELISKEKILAFAQGNPSDAFGEKYKIFDYERQMARLPRPPYFFMDRVTKIDHAQWEMKPGGWIEAEFDVPADGWYFNANYSDTIPFCILLEIALQPCGWLAAWAGSALESNDRLYFRNLGGKAQIFKNIHRNMGTIIMRSRITDVSKAGGMIIQDFDIEVLKNSKLLYKGTTNFGFFSGDSLSNQIGLKNNKFQTYEINTALLDSSKETSFHDNAPLTPDDLSQGENRGMPSTALCMIDKIEQFSLKGGLYNKGYIKATKQVNPDEWFFNAHFYQDPVCPGSLGIESFLQLLKFYSLQKWQFSPEKFKIEETLNSIHEWKYRGQIIPLNRQIEICAHIKNVIDEDGDQPQIIADGALSVDGICIYEMTDFNVSLVNNSGSESLIQIKQAKAES